MPRGAAAASAGRRRRDRRWASTPVARRRRRRARRLRRRRDHRRRRGRRWRPWDAAGGERERRAIHFTTGAGPPPAVGDARRRRASSRRRASTTAASTAARARQSRPARPRRCSRGRRRRGHLGADLLRPTLRRHGPRDYSTTPAPQNRRARRRDPSAARYARACRRRAAPARAPERWRSPPSAPRFDTRSSVSWLRPPSSSAAPSWTSNTIRSSSESVQSLLPALDIPGEAGHAGEPGGWVSGPYADGEPGRSAAPGRGRVHAPDRGPSDLVGAAGLQRAGGNDRQQPLGAVERCRHRQLVAGRRPPARPARPGTRPAGGGVSGQVALTATPVAPSGGSCRRGRGGRRGPHVRSPRRRRPADPRPHQVAPHGVQMTASHRPSISLGVAVAVEIELVAAAVVVVEAARLELARVPLVLCDLLAFARHRRLRAVAECEPWLSRSGSPSRYRRSGSRPARSSGETDLAADPAGRVAAADAVAEPAVGQGMPGLPRRSARRSRRPCRCTPRGPARRSGLSVGRCSWGRPSGCLGEIDPEVLRAVLPWSPRQSG